MKLRATSSLLGSKRKKHECAQSASMGQRFLELLRSDSSGSALVELAIALPVYLIIITGMVSTVMALYAYQSLAFATFTASEVVGAGRGQITDPCATVVNQVVTSLPTWDTNSLRYTIWITENATGTGGTDQYGPLTGSGFTCTGTQTTAGNGNYSLFHGQGEPVTVRVQYNYTWLPIYSDKITTGYLTAAESSYIR
jgi:Flp pilus assembly protein TadG